MPKNKFQEVIFTIMMVFVMVYAMICYNISLNMGGMSNYFFLAAFHELIIMGPIAFILDFFLVGPIAKKKAFMIVNPQKDNPFMIDHKRIIFLWVHDHKCFLLCNRSYEKEIQNESNRSHDDKFMECRQKEIITHSSHIQGDVVADHCINHDKNHHDCENYFLKLIFWHKKILLS